MRPCGVRRPMFRGIQRRATGATDRFPASGHLESVDGDEGGVRDCSLLGGHVRSVHSSQHRSERPGNTSSRCRIVPVRLSPADVDDADGVAHGLGGPSLHHLGALCERWDQQTGRDKRGRKEGGGGEEG